MMNKIRFTTLTLFSTVFALVAFAQQSTDKVLLTIDGKPITQSEFERIYTKNNQAPAFDSVSLSEYMELFVNYKLKVIEAEKLGLDTVKAFQTELKGYITQLEKPYFSDESTDEALFKEAYERMHWDIKASHLLIKCSEDAAPADTLKAYKKAEAFRKRALKGEDFAKLANEASDNPTGAKDGGNLGWFTAFSMVYPFETGAYNTPVGKISEVTRSRFGYHVIKVHDKRPNRGQIKVAHIMLMTPQGTTPEKEKEQAAKIQMIYDSIAGGADWNVMVNRYSEDRNSAVKGGELPYMNTGRMIAEFETATSDMKEINSISKPVKTPYGYHIIKLLEIKPVGSYEELKPTLKEKVSKDIRSQRGKQSVIARLKKEYRFTENKKALDPFYTIIDSTIYFGKWDAVKAAGLSEVMFTIADSVKFTQADFAKAINMDGLRRQKKALQLVIEDEYRKQVEAQVMKFERTQLPKKYPDFKHLTQEYHDGILLFNLTDQMVWSKAVKDSVGLNSFYQANKNNYMWGDRVLVASYELNNKTWEPKLTKMIQKSVTKNLDLKKELDAFIVKAKDTTLKVTLTEKKFSKGDNEDIDKLAWVKGTIASTEKEGKIIITCVVNPILPEPKLLEEAKGIITADYQNYLEKQWIEGLRSKYKVDIDKAVFKEMIK